MKMRPILAGARTLALRHQLVVLTLALAACESSESGLDSSTQPAHPGCAPETACPASASPDAGAVPGPSPSDANSPFGSTPATPPLDTGRTPDAGDAPDASATADAVAPTDSSLPLADAQADGASDAMLPAADAASPYPPVADVSLMGPYTPRTINNTGPNNAYTILHPSELAPNGVLTPILTWGNGGFTTPADYPQLLHFASHGFLVIASNDLFVTGPQVRAGTDWIVQQNGVAGTPFYNKLDVKRVGGVGYSNGGLATLDASDDPRYLTLVIISGANMNETSRTQTNMKLHTPVAYLCTADDASRNNCAGDVAAVTQPVFFGVLNGTGHTDVTTILGGDANAIARSASATTAWMRWHVMGDSSYRSWFVGADCKLCQDTSWTVQQRNLP